MWAFTLSGTVGARGPGSAFGTPNVGRLLFFRTLIASFQVIAGNRPVLEIDIARCFQWPFLHGLAFAPN